MTNVEDAHDLTQTVVHLAHCDVDHHWIGRKVMTEFPDLESLFEEQGIRRFNPSDPPLIPPHFYFETYAQRIARQLAELSRHIDIQQNRVIFDSAIAQDIFTSSQLSGSHTQR